MAAPSGVRLDDGFSSIIEFALVPTIQLWEKTPKPPGVDGGGPTPTTTMRNVTFRTQSPKHLLTLTASSGKCAYDPQVLTNIMFVTNKNQLVKYIFPDGSTWSFYGWLDKFEPDQLQEGVQPEASFTVEPSMQSTIGGTESSVTLTARTSTTTTTSTTP